MEQSRLLSFTLAAALMAPQVVLANDATDDLNGNYEDATVSNNGSWIPYILIGVLGLFMRQKMKEMEIQLGAVRVQAWRANRAISVGKDADGKPLRGLPERVTNLEDAIFGGEDSEGQPLPGLNDRVETLGSSMHPVHQLVFGMRDEQTGGWVIEPIREILASMSQRVDQFVTRTEAAGAEHHCALDQLTETVAALDAAGKACSTELDRLAKVVAERMQPAGAPALLLPDSAAPTTVDAAAARLDGGPADNTADLPHADAAAGSGTDGTTGVATGPDADPALPEIAD